MKNIVERQIVPHNPSPNEVIHNEQYSLFAPIAANGKPGIAAFNTDEFVVKEQTVSIKRAYFTSLYAEYVEGITGDINRGLEEILAIQEALMGGVLYG